MVNVTPRPRFIPGERTPVPVVQEAGWAPEPVWTQRLKEKSFPSAGNRTPIAQPSSPYSDTILACAMAQAVCYRPLTTESRVRSRVNPCGISWEKLYWDRFFSDSSVFPCHYHSTVLHTLISSGGRTICTLLAAVQRRSLGPRNLHSTDTILTELPRLIISIVQPDELLAVFL
jgi:hypothetical protein